MKESLQIDFDKAGGVVPVITQDAETGEVLMLAYMNAEAFQETLRTGRACYYSRARQRLWRKGEESGNHQDVRAIYVDCDRDTVLLKVRQHGGAACHEGYRSCFYRRQNADGWEIIGERVFNPEDVYQPKPPRPGGDGR
ncbi:MAG: phosphoribosyl-AMP cyclohydrolase [Candidatus Binatia bacterium]